MAGNVVKVIAWVGVVAGLLMTTAAAQESATSAPPATRASGPYYVEFRVAQIGAYGHSYAAFGRLDGRGQPASVTYADLHPMGNYALMAVGHVLPVPANTEWDPDVLKLPVASRYRRNLSASQYQKLLAAVRRARANKHPYWNAISNNCNTFIGELAQAVGLRVPGQFQVSYAFVPALREMNESASAAIPGHARAVRKPRPVRSAQTPGS